MADKPIYIPLNRPDNEIVLELVNVVNSITPKLTLQDVELVRVRTGEKDGRNTSLDVVAKEDFAWPGTVSIHYNRLDMSRFGSGGVRQLDGYYYTHTQALEAFNKTFDLGVGASEVASTVVGDNDTIVLTIGESLAYLPGTKLVLKEGFMNMVSRFNQSTAGLFDDIANMPAIPK
jgi:hypothetical protein